MGAKNSTEPSSPAISAGTPASSIEWENASSGTDTLGGQLASDPAQQGAFDEARVLLIKGETELRGVHKLELSKCDVPVHTISRELSKALKKFLRPFLWKAESIQLKSTCRLDGL